MAPETRKLAHMPTQSVAVLPVHGRATHHDRACRRRALAACRRCAPAACHRHRRCRVSDPQ